jgi:chromosome condensin MukBEF complex kleisin-like MukF subunit
MNIPSITKQHLKRVNSTPIQNLSKYARISPNQIDVSDYFLHERPFTNLKIILNHQIIWCDKASLSAASPILREQLLKTTNDNSLVFNDIDYNDFLSMLEFIYPIFNPEINEKNISALIELSYRFQFG